MSSSTLPDQIPPQATPWSYTDSNGDQVVEIHWYLFLYGLWIQVSSLIAGGAVLSPAVNIPMIDSDVFDTDSLLAVRQAINTQLLIGADADAGPTLRDLANALKLSLEDLLPDPIPRAQPAAVVTVGASPFTFTATFNGVLAISGGTVSAVALIRQGVTVPTGATAGLIPVSRLDQVQITYTVAPTVNFLPS
jgi:hypothetical protein